MPQPLLIVSGPTASGKSEIALRLAEHFGGEIVNVDSVQVYRGLDSASAKPSAEERTRVPHHLVDIRDPDEQYHVSAFVSDADRAIEEIRSRGRTPMVVGGTTLYITALLHGLAELPASDPEFRERCARRSSDELHAELTGADPDAAARLHPNDRLRVVRALETFHLTGRPASLLHASHAHRPVRHAGLVIVPVWPRRELYARINERAASFVSSGLLEETREIVRRYGGAVPSLRSLGYAQALEVLAGNLPAQSLSEEIAKATRRFAKRQMTYWRNEPGKRGWRVRPVEGEPIEDGPAGELPLRAMTLEFPALVSELSGAIARETASTELWLLDAERLSG